MLVKCNHAVLFDIRRLTRFDGLLVVKVNFYGLCSYWSQLLYDRVSSGLNLQEFVVYMPCMITWQASCL